MGHPSWCGWIGRQLPARYIAREPRAARCTTLDGHTLEAPRQMGQRAATRIREWTRAGAGAIRVGQSSALLGGRPPVLTLYRDGGPAGSAHDEQDDEADGEPDRADQQRRAQASRRGECAHQEWPDR